MTVKIWRSYSCNNSSSYRLLARFVDASTAASVADELAAFFAAHAVEIDQRLEDTEVASETQRALGEKYGFTWEGLVSWGGGLRTSARPDLVVEGVHVVVHHQYCSGFSQLGAYLRARGGVVDGEQRADLQVTVMFRCANPDPTLDAELTMMTTTAPFKPAWHAEYEASGTVAWFRDAGTFGLHAPVDPRDLSEVRRWLARKGIDPVIRLGERGDAWLFEYLASTRCRSCEGALEYLDPGLHDIETAQLICRACGGLYDLEAFLG